MFEIQIDSGEIERALNRLAESTGDMTPAMRAIGEYAASEVDLTFRDGKDPYGNPWAPLSDVTLARRAGHGGKPLNDTGALKASVTSNPSRHGVEIGTNEIYAKTHQLGAGKGRYGTDRRGGPIPWGDIPARPFLPTGEHGWPDDWERGILAIVRRYLEAGRG